jgi:hypothetical protein
MPSVGMSPELFLSLSTAEVVMRCLRVAGLVVSLLSAALTSTSWGQDQPPGKLDLAYVTDDFFAAMVVRPATLLKSPLIEALPIVGWTESIKAGTGIELEQIEQLVVLLPRPEKGLIYQAGGIVRFRAPIVDKALVARWLKPLEIGELSDVAHAGKTYWTAPGARQMAAHAPDAKTLVFANEECLKAMIDGSGRRGGLVERLAAVSADDDLSLVAEIEPTRKPLANLLEYVRGDAATPVIFTSEIAARLKAATIALRLRGDVRFHAALEATDDKAAELVHDLLRGGGGMLKLAAISSPKLVKANAQGGIVQQWQLRLTGEAIDQVVSGLKISREKNSVLANFAAPPGFSRSIAKLVIATSTAQAANNLRQLGLAMHNHHDVYNALPAHASYSKEGKPLLSWRVHLLPFIEGQDLYKQFHLDEPWDSPHNKKLIERMPAGFRSPGRVLAAGKTCYLLPVGGDEKYRPIFAEKPKRMQNGAPIGNGFGVVTDGLSNTLMIVEAAPDRAVIWTKPDDWEFDPKEPKKGLFGMRKGFFLGTRGDASVRAFPEVADDRSLRCFVGRSDGESFDIGGDYVPVDADDK